MVEFVPGSSGFLFNFTQEEYNRFLDDKNYSSEEFYNKHCVAITKVSCSKQKDLTREDGIKMLENIKRDANKIYIVTTRAVKN